MPTILNALAAAAGERSLQWWARPQTLNHTGPITISGQTSPEQLRAALKALETEIAKFDQPGYFTQFELDAQKAHRAVTSAFDRERASGFAHTLGFWWSVASLEYYMGYVDNMASQTISELHAACITRIARHSCTSPEFPPLTLLSCEESWLRLTQPSSAPAEDH